MPGWHIRVYQLKDGEATRRLLHRAPLVILLLPVFITFLYVRAFAVEMPYCDDWGIGIPQLPHLGTGSLAWSDLDVQHNESQILFPQLVHLATAKVARYRVLIPIYISYFFLCGSLFVLFLLFRRLRPPGRWSMLWFLPVSVFFMSWRQSEGLLWSTHLLNTMAVFFSLLALYCCIHAHRSPYFSAAATVSAWMAAFSMASGVLIWAIGWIYLAVSGRLEVPKARLRRLAGWSLMGGACVTCFMLDRPPHSIGWQAGIAYALAHLGTAGQYTLIYLGSPFSHDPDRAIWAGTAFVFVAAVSVYFTIGKALRQDGVLAALLLIALVTMTLGPLLAFRLDLGPEEAISSRYVTLGSLAAIGVYFCLLALIHRTAAARYLLVVLAALFALGVVDSYVSGLEDGRENRAYETNCAAIVRDFHHRSPDELECANPDAQGILGSISYLERHHLSLFR
jgi:hypothetical protein